MDADPVPNFSLLAPGTYLYSPSLSTPSHQPGPPAAAQGASTHPRRLILLCTWMGAQAKHIAKYSAQYQRLYPSATILLIRTSLWDILRQHPAYHRARLAAARSFLTHFLAANSPSTSASSLAANSSDHHQQQRAEITAHVFSNGGSAALISLLRQLQPTRVALHALLIDSAPSKPNLALTAAAMAQPWGRSSWLVRLLARVCVYAFLAGGWLLDQVLRRDNFLIRLRKAMLDQALLGRETPRTYLYGPGDKMVAWRDVKEHADDARRAGVRRVDEVWFEGTGHVAHVASKEGAERYWAVVRREVEREDEGGDAVGSVVMV